jgi:ADP-ribose pyrophosphatase
VKKPLLVGEELLFRGLRFNVARRRYSRPDTGEIFERDVVVFPEAAAVLPLLGERRVVLLRQFRAPLNDYIIEVPAGVVNQGETPEETAKRELIEETGYHPRVLEKLGSFTPTPGYSSEVLHLYVARDLEYVGVRPERYEVIEPLVVEFSEAYKMVLEGVIRDMKTALTILLYASRAGVSP